MTTDQTTTSGRRQQAHDRSVRGGTDELTDFLRSLLGQKLVAHIANVSDDRRVGKWIKGEKPSDAAAERIRVAYKVAWLLMQEDSEEIVRAWFIGMNPQLNDVPPASAIAAGHYRDVMHAAEAFLAGG